MKFVKALVSTGLFLFFLSWGAPQGCAQLEQPGEAIEAFNECDAVVELLGDNLRPTIGYALGSHEQNAGEVRSAGSLTVRGDSARGVLRYRYHSRFGLEAVVESQGQEITLAECGGGSAGAAHQLAATPDRLRFDIEGVSDLARVDLEAVQSSVLSAARDEWPDAVVVNFHATNIYPEGHADLTLGEGAKLTMIVGAPPSADESLPKGASGSQTPHCLMVFVDRDKKVISDTIGQACAPAFKQGKVPTRQKCSAEQIWDRAVKAGAPSENAVATMSYTASMKSWAFSIDEFVRSFPDDC